MANKPNKRIPNYSSWNVFEYFHAVGGNLIENKDENIKTGDPNSFNYLPRRRGLRNLGNTCYMNAALQALFSVQPFCDLAFSRSWEIDNGGDGSGDGTDNQAWAPVCNAVADVLTALDSNCNQGSERAINPRIILDAIRKRNSIFRGYQQQDTPEFLTTLLEAIHDELKHPTAKTQPNPSICTSNTLHGTSPTPQSSPSSFSSSQSPKKKSKPNSRSNKNRSQTNTTNSSNQPPQIISILSDLFDGQLTSTAKCLHCQTTSSTKETFQILTLPIPQVPRDDSVENSRTNSRSYSSVNSSETPMLNDETSLDGDLNEFGQSPENSRNRQKSSSKPTATPSADTSPSLSTGTQVASSATLFQMFLKNYIFYIILSIIMFPVKTVKQIMSDRTVSLSDCLHEFFKVDHLTKENMYHCDSCKKLRNGQRFYKLASTPSVLIFHLKRFKQFDIGPVDSGHGKYNKHVNFKEFYSFRGERYRLNAVVCHHGYSGQYGHYTSYVRHSETWYHCDDSHVEKVKKSDVLQVQAYVLFYSKISSETHKSKKQWLLENVKKYSGDKNICWLSQRSLHQLVYNTCDPNEIVLNADITCDCRNRSLETKHQSYLAISVSMWESIVEKLKGDKNRHFFLDQEEFCGICTEEKRKIKVRQGDELRMLDKILAERGRERNFEEINTGWLEQWENFVNRKSERVPGKIPMKGGSTQVIGKLRQNLVIIYGVEKS